MAGGATGTQIAEIRNESKLVGEDYYRCKEGTKSYHPWSRWLANKKVIGSPITALGALMHWPLCARWQYIRGSEKTGPG